MAELEQFLGDWEEDHKSGFEEMAKALQLPEEKKCLYGQCKTTISYERDGDEWKINVGTKEHPNCRQFKFHLGQPYDSEDIDGSPMKSLVNADGSKLVEKHTNQNIGAEMEVTRWVEGGNMMVKTCCGGNSMMTHYKKK